VIDGDTIEIAGRRIRIFGIDAPEEDQTCERGGGGTWYCGAEATRLLSRMARSQIVECRVRATDIYGRYVALCSVGDEDLGRAMVRSGFAISSSRNSEYASEENDARVGRLGI
jgi:endonuclease YncB( thermonuclease family)